MKRLVARRLISSVPVLFFLSVIVFALIFLLPGDPVAILMGDEADPKLLELYRKQLGFDRPIPVQYVDWLSGVVTGDWGRSLRTHEHVLVEIRNRLPVTLELGVLALLLSLVVAVPIGIYSAARPNTAGDTVGTVLAIWGVAMPSFWTGILLIYLFAVILGWLPSGGWVSLFDDPVQNLKRIALPVLALGMDQTASVMRQTRSAMLEVLRQDYIRTAYSKGLASRTVLTRHAFRSALIPVVTILGLRFGRLLGGTVIIETIFGLPGIGRLAATGALMLDLPVVQGVLLLLGVSVILANLVTDIAYGFLDPRIRYT